MGNITDFRAIDLDLKVEPLSFHYFEKTFEHGIWEFIIPDDVPNDLKYRLEYGPAYVGIDPSNPKDIIFKPLRQPKVVYSDSRLYKLNSQETSVFEIEEFKLITKFVKKRIDSGDLGSWEWTILPLYEGLTHFFSSDYSYFDAIILVYAS